MAYPIWFIISNWSIKTRFLRTLPSIPGNLKKYYSQSKMVDKKLTLNFGQSKYIPAGTIVTVFTETGFTLRKHKLQSKVMFILMNSECSTVSIFVNNF